MSKKIQALILALVIIIFSVFAIASGSDSNEVDTSAGETSQVETEDNPEDEVGAEAEAGASEYSVGERVVISEDGTELYAITINSVKFTDERNEYSDIDPKSVVVINYTYENIAKDEDLYISSLYFKVIDSDGNVCETYPAGTTSYAQGTPLGAKCTADEAYGLMSDGADFKLLFYNDMFGSTADATFLLTAE